MIEPIKLKYLLLVTMISQPWFVAAPRTSDAGDVSLDPSWTLGARVDIPLGSTEAKSCLIGALPRSVQNDRSLSSFTMDVARRLRKIWVKLLGSIQSKSGLKDSALESKVKATSRPKRHLMFDPTNDSPVKLLANRVVGWWWLMIQPTSRGYVGHGWPWQSHSSGATPRYPPVAWSWPSF